MRCQDLEAVPPLAPNWLKVPCWGRPSCGGEKDVEMISFQIEKLRRQSAKLAPEWAIFCGVPFVCLSTTKTATTAFPKLLSILQHAGG